MSNSREEWSIDHGTMMNDYEVIRPIRSSHKWVTYLARDKKKNRVALTYIDKEKMLEKFQISAFDSGTPHEDLEKAANEYLHKYQDELKKTVERAKGLANEHVAMIHGCSYDRERDQLVIVSEYTPGVEISYATARLSPKQSVFLFSQALDGLGFIHANGLLHLNIKPSRIYVDFEADVPMVKLTDFGFAIPIQEYKSKPGGTLFYMAPEVALDKKESIDARADLFSFGATMYFCLTGRQPLGDRFVAQQNRQKLLTIVEHEKSVSIPPSNYNKDIPQELDEIILKLLEKDPDKRTYASAQDVLNTIYEKWPEESTSLTKETTSTLFSYE